MTLCSFMISLSASSVHRFNVRLSALPRAGRFPKMTPRLGTHFARSLYIESWSCMYTLSSPNFLGHGIHSHCSGQLSLLPIGWLMSTSFCWGSKSLCALVGLASNTWGCPWRPKHHVRQHCPQVADIVKRCWSICKRRYIKFCTLNLLTANLL